MTWVLTVKYLMLKYKDDVPWPEMDRGFMSRQNWLQIKWRSRACSSRGSWPDDVVPMEESYAGTEEQVRLTHDYCEKWLLECSRQGYLRDGTLMITVVGTPQATQQSDHAIVGIPIECNGSTSLSQ